MATRVPTASTPPSHHSRTPDSAMMPTSKTSIRITTPRSGSSTTRPMGKAAQPTASTRARILGLLSDCRSSPRIMAVIKMMASLANSDGSIWKPLISEIQE